mmetsp:Transcript_4365/g.10139  ORF Transcript_4365/g.10139 Transcript_4365/m.10139 type:complete len:103 (+) Transcript_4365:111-419(+)
MVGLRTRLHATGGQPAILCWSQRLATAAFPAANGEPCEEHFSESESEHQKGGGFTTLFISGSHNATASKRPLADSAQHCQECHADDNHPKPASSESESVNLT